MTKRVAQSQMTKENWMNEDDREDPGQFEHAGSGRLQNRNIKKAKRRLPENGVASSPFSQFAGFVGEKSPMFNFQAKLPTSNGSDAAKSAKVSSMESDKSTPVKPFAILESLFQTKAANSPSVSNEHSKNLGDKTSKDSSKQSGQMNFDKLKQLNKSFLSWIQEHMTRNEFCDFTPVCLDYVEHIKRMEPSPDVAASSAKSEPALKPKPQSQTNADFLSKTPTKISDETSQPKPALGVNFFAKKDEQETTSSPLKLFTFSAASQNTVPSKVEPKKDDDEDYVPPKNDFLPASEEGSLYSKRCKLFFKKDGNFVDKGVGTLHIKALEEKKQLFVRADTSTGLILLNISLSESLPTERLGKNNVLVVCVPNPDVDPEPTSVLFRVKTSEDADELLDKLVKYKSSS